MNIEIVHPGPNAMVKVNLQSGQILRAEAGAMVAKSANVKVEGTLYGGVGKAVTRKFLGRERFFFQTLTAEGGEGEVLIAPAGLGEITLLHLRDGLEYYLQGGSFVAALGDIGVDTEMQRLEPGLVSGEGLFVLRCRGEGVVAVSAFGGLYDIEISSGSDYVIDHGHLVAWTAGMKYEVGRAAQGWVNTITSGEGYVCRFTGPGLAFIQTRNPHGFGSWLREFLPLGG